MMSVCLCLSVYRLFCAIGYGYVSYWTVQNFKPKSVSLENSFISQLQFLTFDTTLLQSLYFAFALILMPTKFQRIKSSLAAMALTTSIVISVSFWALMYKDSGLLFTKENLTIYPNWHMHVTHSLITVTALFDVVIGRPSTLPFFKSSLLLVLFYGSYITYTEYVIKTMNLYAYPMLKTLEQKGRLQLYGVFAVGLFFIHCFVAILIKLIGVSDKPKKSKKGKKSGNLQQAIAKPKIEAKKQKQKKQD